MDLGAATARGAPEVEVGQVDLDAQTPRGVPEVRFLGADSVVLPYRDRLNASLLQVSLQNEGGHDRHRLKFPIATAAPSAASNFIVTASSALLLSHKASPIKGTLRL